MYGELASIREIVNLSSRETLDSGKEFLIRLGYDVLRETETSLTVGRPRPDEPEQGLLNVTIEVQSQPEGGVRVRIRGNDREGITKWQADWREWAESLPKVAPREDGERSLIVMETGYSTSETRLEETGQKTSLQRQENGGQEPYASSDYGERAVETTDYEYKMVQIPPTVSVSARDHKGDEAASYLQEIANTHAAAGWEFYRVDTLSVSIPPGCLGVLFGDRGTQSQYYVVTFRQPRYR